jgi:hypothetical protein
VYKDSTNPEIQHALDALNAVERDCGTYNVLFVLRLEEYAKVLRRHNRVLDAANVEARARSIKKTCPSDGSEIDRNVQGSAKRYLDENRNAWFVGGTLLVIGVAGWLAVTQGYSLIHAVAAASALLAAVWIRVLGWRQGWHWFIVTFILPGIGDLLFIIMHPRITFIPLMIYIATGLVMFFVR